MNPFPGLTYSLLAIGYGMLIGGLLGVLCWLALKWWPVRPLDMTPEEYQSEYDRLLRHHRPWMSPVDTTKADRPHVASKDGMRS